MLRNRKETDEGSPKKLLLSAIAFIVVVTGVTNAQKGEGKEPVIQAIFNEMTILSAAQSRGGVGGGSVIMSDDAIVASGVPFASNRLDCYESSSNKVRVHTVREGETISQLAEVYCVSEQTIAWHNDIHKTGNIRIGQELIILPVHGVSHEVKEGETIEAIAKKYDGNVEEIMLFNNISNTNDLVEGLELIIPGGEIEGFAITSHYHHHSAGGGHSAVRGAGGPNLDHMFVSPLSGGTITQGLHGYNAVDFGAKWGTPIVASAGGKVIIAKDYGWNGGYGKYVVIEHPNGVQTLYSHLGKVSVFSGQTVAQSQKIGSMGNTGHVIALNHGDGTHLHFEVRGALNPFR